MEAPKSMWLVAADRALVAGDFVEKEFVVVCESCHLKDDNVWLTLLNVGKKKRSAQVHGLLPSTAGQLWIEQRVGNEEGEMKLNVHSDDVGSGTMIGRHIGTLSAMCLVKSKGPSRKRGSEDEVSMMSDAEKKLQHEYRMLRMKMKVNRMKEALAEKEVDPVKKAKEEARRKLDEECMQVKGRMPYKRSDTTRFIEGAPLWFHMEFQKFNLRYDIDDLIDWEPIDEQHRPRFQSNYPEDFLNRRPDWQNYDIDDEKISSMRSIWTMKLTDRRERWYAEVAALSKEEQDAFAEVRKTMLADAVSALKDEGRIGRCVEALGRQPLRRSDQRFFTSGAGLSFHIYVQGFDLTHDIDDVYQGPALLTKRPRVRITDVEDALVCFEKEWDADYDISEVEAGLIIRTLKERVAKMSCPYKAKLSFNYPYV